MCRPDAALGFINAGAPLLLMSLRRLTTTFRLTLFFFRRSAIFRVLAHRFIIFYGSYSIRLMYSFFRFSSPSDVPTKRFRWAL